jgi:ParB/RepB/Spo0J family partition protein
MQIETNRLHLFRTLLRVVRKDTAEFLALRDSIKKSGQLMPLLVRKHPTKPDEFEIIDGAYRFTALKALRRKTAECKLVEATDAQVLALQIQANACRVETTKWEYAKQLLRIRKGHPEITLNEMAIWVSQSAMWVKRMLHLNYLRADYRQFVDRDEMTIGNAVELSKIPPTRQPDFLDYALVENTRLFAARVAAALKAIKEGARDAKLRAFFVDDHVHQPYLRDLADVLLERNSLSRITPLLVKHNVTNPIDAARLALDWVSNCTEDAIAEQRARAERRLKRDAKQRMTHAEQNF